MTENKKRNDERLNMLARQQNPPVLPTKNGPVQYVMRPVKVVDGVVTNENMGA